MARLPSTPVKTVKEAKLVAGPANRNTRAAPGLTPFRIRAAAMGVEAVAQIYSGIPTASMISMAGSPAPRYSLNISGGISTVINPASTMPIRNQPARSSQRSSTAKRMPALSFSPKVWWFRCSSGAQFSPSQQPSTGQLRSGAMRFVSLFEPKRFSVMPATAAVTKATNGRATVMIGSSSA